MWASAVQCLRPQLLCFPSAINMVVHDDICKTWTSFIIRQVNCSLIYVTLSKLEMRHVRLSSIHLYGLHISVSGDTRFVWDLRRLATCQLTVSSQLLPHCRCASVLCVKVYSVICPLCLMLYLLSWNHSDSFDYYLPVLRLSRTAIIFSKKSASRKSSYVEGGGRKAKKG